MMDPNGPRTTRFVARWLSNERCSQAVPVARDAVHSDRGQSESTGGDAAVRVPRADGKWFRVNDGVIVRR